MSRIVFSDKVRYELVKLLYQQSTPILWAESFGALVVTFALWGKLSSAILLTWLISNLIICGAARHFLVYQFNHSKKTYAEEEMNTWLWLFGIGAFLSGLSWGAAGWFLMVDADLLSQGFIIFLLLGVTASANLFYSANRCIYLLFLVPAFTPLVIWLFLQGQALSLLGILAIVYMMLMLIISNAYNALIKKSLDLRFANVDLVSSLLTAKNSLEKRSSMLEKTLSLVSATLESTTDGILVVDMDNNIENYNKRFIKMWDLPEKKLKNKKIDALFIFISNQLVDPHVFLNSYQSMIIHPEDEIHIELLFRDGKIFELYSQPQLLGNTCVGYVLSFRDISRHKKLEQRLFHQANFDSLTNLPNRALLLDRFTHALSYAKQGDMQLIVFYIDIDRFKLINDMLGHSIGNKLLVEVSHRLQACVNENDTVSREAGDEFIIMITSLSEESDTINLARKCLAAMHGPFIIEGHKINITISMGISFWPKDGRDADSLIKKADIAMYKAKELGRNNFQFFTEEMNKRVLDKLIMENQLRNALEQNEFSVLYQPYVSLKTGKIVGMEALLRWQHPLLGNVMPVDFIPVAEECGIISLIGEWVLRVACAQAKEWQRKGIKDIQISVNLSSSQFKQANFYEQIQQIVSGIGLDPHLLALELTESILMEDVEKNIEVLNKLKQMGILIVIDDFGVGYSSLNYLKKLPVDKLKIDKSFIQDVPHHGDDAAIAAAIIALASKINLKVIAEGVENEAQIKFLIKHYCDEIQGFYFSNPIDGETTIKLLRENKAMILPSII